MNESFLILFGFLMLSFLYASIGHGGASGYLALMAIFSLDPHFLRPSALILNLFVSAFSFILFAKKWRFKYKLLLTLLISSLPAAYIGAKTELDPLVFKWILAGFLVLASVRLVFNFKRPLKERKFNPILTILIGGLLGFCSGLIGIGGGIILSPIVLLLGWANVKETAVLSAAFIWLNSLFGLFGLYSAGLLSPSPDLKLWIPMVIIGGILGAYFGSYRFKGTTVKIVLSLVLFTASLKLFFF